MLATYPTNFGTVGASVVDPAEGRAYLSGQEATTNVIRRVNITNGVVEAVYRPAIQYLAFFVNPWTPCLDIDSPAPTVSWQTALNLTYRLQTAPTPLGTWSNVGSAVVGQGGVTQVNAAVSAGAVLRIITGP